MSESHQDEGGNYVDNPPYNEEYYYNSGQNPQQNIQQQNPNSLNNPNLQLQSGQGMGQNEYQLAEEPAHYGSQPQGSQWFGEVHQ